jgi:N-methylhydantoinase B
MTTTVTVDDRIGMDVITFEVLMGAFTSICRHMAIALRRAAYSPIIHDAMDLSAAYLDADLNLITQQEGCPIHLGTLCYSARWAIKEYGPENLHEGDILVVNDPYRGGVHLNDVGFIGPVYWKGQLIGYVANRAHWPDIGGSEPSGVVSGRPIMLLNEGLIFPPIKIRHSGELDQDLISFILANVRAPEERIGDLLAQVAAIDIGARRVPQVVEKYGMDTIRDFYRETLEYSKRRMAKAIAAIPEGVYQYEDQMDDDGITMESIPVKVTITVKDGKIQVDFTGTGPQVEAPINSSWGMSLTSTLIILKALLDPYGPVNSGWWDLVDIHLPEGSLVNPRPGAPVFGAGVETGLRIYDIIQGALKDAIPHRVTGALYGTIDTSFMSGLDPETGKYYIYNDWIPGGWGGKYDSDGISCMIELCGNTDDIPIEVAELKYPLRYQRSELRVDSGGTGKYRGGLGTLREIQVLRGKARASTQADRTKTPPFGVFGGGPAATTRYSKVHKDGSVEVLGGKRPDGTYGSAKRNFNVLKGEALRMEAAGGGGYGNPRQRDRRLVLEDVLDGYVSLKAAQKDYGIEFTPEEMAQIEKVLAFQKYGDE